MISIITPMYNEQETIVSFLDSLLLRIQDMSLITEVILVNGESTDQSVQNIEQRLLSYTWSLHISLLQSKKSRAIQQNYWAMHAKWEILFFLHVDCLPEVWFETKLAKAQQQWHTWWVCKFSRTPATRYTICIDRVYNTKCFYRCRFGDSWIIVSKKIFCEIGWFDERRVIEEDHLLLMELWKRGKFTIYPIKLFVSDRLFRANGFLRTLLTYLLIHWLFLCWYSQDKLLYILRTIKWQKNLSSSIMQNQDSEMQ